MNDRDKRREIRKIRDDDDDDDIYIYIYIYVCVCVCVCVCERIQKSSYCS